MQKQTTLPLPVHKNYNNENVSSFVNVLDELEGQLDSLTSSSLPEVPLLDEGQEKVYETFTKQLQARIEVYKYLLICRRLLNIEKTYETLDKLTLSLKAQLDTAPFKDLIRVHELLSLHLERMQGLVHEQEGYRGKGNSNMAYLKQEIAIPITYKERKTLDSILQSQRPEDGTEAEGRLIEAHSQDQPQQFEIPPTDKMERALVDSFNKN